MASQRPLQTSLAPVRMLIRLSPPRAVWREANCKLEKMTFLNDIVHMYMYKAVL